MYAIIRRYREKDDKFMTGHVHYGFTDRHSAETWNTEHFPSPDYNLIVPCSEVRTE